MAVVCHRGFAISVWGIALCAVVLASSSPLLPSFTTLLIIALIGSMMIGLVRAFGARRRVTVLPVAGTQAQPGGILNILTGARHVRTIQPTRAAATEEANDALDLVRMEDDGGCWRMPSDPSSSIPRPPAATDRHDTWG
jgi:hypothetical protein